MSDNDLSSRKPDISALFWQEAKGQETYVRDRLIIIFIGHIFYLAPLIGLVNVFIDFFHVITNPRYQRRLPWTWEGTLHAWFWIAFWTISIHLTIAFFIALYRANGSRVYLNARHQEWKNEQERLRKEQEEKEKQNVYSQKFDTLLKLLDEAEKRRLAPAKRLAFLEEALQEAFNRYRFAHDVTGTADLKELRRGFIQNMQSYLVITDADLGLISNTKHPQVKALMQALLASKA